MRQFWMRGATVGCALTVAVWTPGCAKTTDSGGPGAVTDSNGAAVDNNDTFSLTIPASETEIMPGEEQTLTIEINRGLQFDQTVTLSFEAPAGLTVDPQSSTVSSGSDEVEVKIKADTAATPGKHTVHVVGMPTSGKDVTGDFVVQVKESSST